MKPALTRYRCAICQRRLREGQYVFSRWTRQRYCCDLDCKKKRRGGREAPSLST